MLVSHLRKSLIFFTQSSWVFLMSILQAFYHHLNIILLPYITLVCSEIPCSGVSRYEETSYLNFTAIQLTGCHATQDLGVGNIYIYYIYIIYIYVYYIYIHIYTYIYVYIYIYIYIYIYTYIYSNEK